MSLVHGIPWRCTTRRSGLICLVQGAPWTWSGEDMSTHARFRLSMPAPHTTPSSAVAIRDQHSPLGMERRPSPRRFPRLVPTRLPSGRAPSRARMLPSPDSLSHTLPPLLSSGPQGCRLRSASPLAPRRRQRRIARASKSFTWTTKCLFRWGRPRWTPFLWRRARAWRWRQRTLLRPWLALPSLTHRLSGTRVCAWCTWTEWHLG